MNMNPTYWNVFPKQPPVKYNFYKIKESRKSLLNLNLLKIILTFFCLFFCSVWKLTWLSSKCNQKLKQNQTAT